MDVRMDNSSSVEMLFCTYEFCVKAGVGTKTDSACVEVQVRSTSPPSISLSTTSVSEHNPDDTCSVSATACYPGARMELQWERNDAEVGYLVLDLEANCFTPSKVYIFYFWYNKSVSKLRCEVLIYS